jgi:hypothetical protein
VIAVQPKPLDKKAALGHIEKTNPETLALSYDWEDIAIKVVRTQEKTKACVMCLNCASPFDPSYAGFHLLNPILKHWGWLICTTVRFCLLIRCRVTYRYTPQRLFSHMPQHSPSISTFEPVNITHSVLSSSALIPSFPVSFSSNKHLPRWKS